MRRKDIYTEAWNITRHYKFLWIFGFIAGITFNTKGGTTDVLSSGGWLFQNIELLIGNNTGVNLVGVMLLAILFWLLGITARADLIYGTAKVINKTKEAPISFKAIFLLGLNVLPKLAVMQVIVWLPITLLTTWSIAQNSGFPLSENGFSLVNFAGISSFVVISVVLTLALSFIDAFAFRSIVLKGTDIFGSIQEAVQILRHNLSKILTTAVVCAVIGFIVSIVIGIPLAPVMAILMSPVTGPIQEAMRECMSNNNDVKAMAECVQGMATNSTTFPFLFVASIVLAAFYSVWTTFLSTVFTILYSDIVGLNTRRKKTLSRKAT